MAESDEWTDWHLTERGWERGSEKNNKVIDRPDPPGSVLVYRFSEYVSSIYSKPDRSCDLLRGDESEPAVKALLEKHGPAPRRL